MLYTAKDIKRILDITPGQLFHWGRTWGLIEPEIKAKGRQGKNKYSLENLYQLALIKKLVNMGIELSVIERLLKSTDILNFFKEDQRRAYLIIHGISVYDVKEFYNLTRKETPNIYLVISVWEIKKEIEEKILEKGADV